MPRAMRKPAGYISCAGGFRPGHPFASIHIHPIHNPRPQSFQMEEILIWLSTTLIRFTLSRAEREWDRFNFRETWIAVQSFQHRAKPNTNLFNAHRFDLCVPFRFNHCSLCQILFLLRYQKISSLQPLESLNLTHLRPLPLETLHREHKC